MINDVRALRAEGALATAARLGVPICLVHMRGEPGTMQAAPHYHEVVREVRDFLLDQVSACERAGIGRDRLYIDPGFGFGKTLEHNLRLLGGLQEFVATGLPVVVGVSRKSMIGAVTGRNLEDRLHGSVAGAVIAALKGAAVVRVHDVAPTVDALRVVEAIGADH
jgi:dihydropteroate synthase